jgi:hypothetical protein
VAVRESKSNETHPPSRKAIKGLTTDVFVPVLVVVFFTDVNQSGIITLKMKPPTRTPKSKPTGYAGIEE